MCFTSNLVTLSVDTRSNNWGARLDDIQILRSVSRAIPCTLSVASYVGYEYCIFKNNITAGVSVRAHAHPCRCDFVILNTVFKSAKKYRMSLKKQTTTAAKVAKMSPINREISFMPGSRVFAIIQLDRGIKILEIDEHEELIG